MDIENNSDIDKMDFMTLEKLSQECSNRILFNMLKKNTTSEGDSKEINKCKLLVNEYQKRVLKKHELNDLNPVEN